MKQQPIRAFLQLRTEHEKPHQFFYFFSATTQLLLIDSLLSWLMVINCFRVGLCGFAGQMCFYTWLSLNELEPEASTCPSGPLQHTGELGYPVWSDYIRGSWTCGGSRGSPALRAWAKCGLPLDQLEPDAITHFSDPLQHMGERVSPV